MPKRLICGRLCESCRSKNGSRWCGITCGASVSSRLLVGWAPRRCGQAVAGIALVAAGLQESIPGRSWSRPALVAWFVLPLLLVIVATYGAWYASPIVFPASVSVVAMCLGSSLVSGLPVIALSWVLARRAWPIRPTVSGALTGVGTGLMADAGWRLSVASRTRFTSCLHTWAV